MSRPLTASLLATALAGLPAAATAQDAAPAAGPALPGLSGLSASLILDGVAYTDSLDGDGAAFTGEAAGISHAHGHDHGGHDHGGIEEGFNLRESELVLSATVDDWFDAWANLAFSADGVELEEAHVTTRALPAGWQARAGKFYSGFGYANSKHPHSRDFVDQDLAYLTLAGDHGLNDTGLQLTWLPAMDTFLQVGVEVLQGHDQEIVGAAVEVDEVAAALLDELGIGTGDAEADGLPALERRGPQLFTAFLKVAPDLGAGQALQLGISSALHKSQQEFHEEGDPVTDMFYADGDARLSGVELVWKRSPTGGYGEGGLRVAAEYLRLEKDLDVVFHTDPAELGMPLSAQQDGAYVQAVYGFAPRWEAGLRWDATGLDSSITEGGTTIGLPDSSRVAGVVTYRHSEFSYLRLQLAQADITDEAGTREDFTQVMLQYNLSLGAHGAHSF